MNVYKVKLVRIQATLGDDPDKIENAYYVASDILKVWDALTTELHDENVEVLSIEVCAPVLAVLG